MIEGIMNQEISFLDPKVLASISNLELRAKTAVEGFVSGLHRSPHRGFSVEFTDYRHYNPGDDIRHVDWKIYARSGEYFIKQYQDETNVRCHILLDCSASMGYGSGTMTKLEYGRTLAAALSYFMFSQKDAVGLTAFDDNIREYLPARYRRGHLMLILRALAHINPGERTHLARSISELAPSTTNSTRPSARFWTKPLTSKPFASRRRFEDGVAFVVLAVPVAAAQFL